MAEMSKEELIPFLKTMKASYSDLSKESGDVDEPKVSKTNTSKLHNPDHEAQLTSLLAKFIPDIEDKTRFNDWLLKNTIPDQPIKFNVSATQLVHAFKTLFDHRLLNVRYKTQVRKWLVDHFLYLDMEKPQSFKVGSVTTLLKKNSKAPLYPILEVINQQVVSPKPLEPKKTPKKR